MSRPTFCGLSVQGWKTSLGWGRNTASTLTVELVQDVANGDFPAAPPLGTPIQFDFFDFHFGGLLQKWTTRRSPNGFPIYEAQCVDPREILEGTVLITDHYYGSVTPMVNLLNVFGWWEQNFGYGSSQVNDTGMPWSLVEIAMLNICDSPVYGPYGGPMSFRGFAYSLDLSELPVPGPDYRLSGSQAGHMTVLEAIDTICDDGGCDYFVELDGFRIKIRTQSRLLQPPLGTIAALTDTNFGNVLRTEDGIEIRNETTSAFLVGGDVCNLYQTDFNSVASFWGYDVDGNPILGTRGTFTFLDRAGKNIIGQIDTDFMTLNATGVTDIIGSLGYPCSTLEMRCAMHNYDSWASFIRAQRPDIAPFVFSPFDAQAVPGPLAPAPQVPLIKPNVVAANPAAAAQVAMAALTTAFHQKAQRLYEFVKAYGQDFYGKKFLVGIPFTLTRQDATTLKISYSQDVADGGWLPEGSAPLALSLLNEDVFKIQDGRFRAFVAFADVIGIDTSRVSPQDTIIQNGVLYMKANVNKNILFLPNGQPSVLLTLNAALHLQSLDTFGGTSLIMQGMLGVQPNVGQKIFDGAFGNFGCRIWPEALMPDACAIPLKSSLTAYGPWYASGAAGKVRMEVDQTLTPWNYGTFDAMDAAAQIKVLNVLTNMQISETGTLELVGPPTASLGDTLQAGGPNITAIDVSYGREGVTTSYRFQTFTPRFGVFNKQLGESLKRFGNIGTELRKAIRAGINQGADLNQTVDTAFRGFVANLPKAVNRQSPHEVLACHSVDTYDTNGNFLGWRVCPKSLTFEESIGVSRADDNVGYANTAIMSLDGLLRPFSTAYSGSTGMPGLTQPAGAPSGVYPMSSVVLAPFVAGNDVTYLTSGSTYRNLHSWMAGNDPASTRAIALRGPVMVSGWGYDLQGNPAPGDGQGGWMPNLLRRSDAWKVGPLDPLWDTNRGVWTFHTSRMAMTGPAIASRGSGNVVLTSAGSGVLAVWNPWSMGVSGNTLVTVAYMADTNRWNIIAADCTP